MRGRSCVCLCVCCVGETEGCARCGEGGVSLRALVAEWKDMPVPLLETLNLQEAVGRQRF